MVTNETKNGRKFIKMYDPETGEYLGPLVNMTHEEAHGKKIVKSSIVTISCVSDLSEISLNVPLLVYALYYERYNNSILPSSQMDIVFDIVSAMLELKKEGMIQ